MNKLLEITVRGKSKTWGFEFYGDPKHLAEWRADGLEVDEICNTIPLWLPACLTRAWCIAQDILHFNLEARMNALTFDFATDVRHELERARAKFPTNENKAHALTEEAGEVIKALLEHKYESGIALDVYKECVQTAAMAQRVAEEGDAGFPYTRDKAVEDDAWAVDESAWGTDRSVDTKVLAQAMMSAIRFGHRSGSRYQTEMRRLCNLIDSANQQKEEACVSVSALDAASQSKAETVSAEESAAASSPRKSNQKSAAKSAAVKSAAPTVASSSRKKR